MRSVGSRLQSSQIALSLLLKCPNRGHKSRNCLVSGQTGILITFSRCPSERIFYQCGVFS
uniref:Uncharacterized protein n=1 Tax=Anguilla anguilla TaxID=7936 RepID=A0A0E9X957_ANGAN